MLDNEMNDARVKFRFIGLRNEGTHMCRFSLVIFVCTTHAALL